MYTETSKSTKGNDYVAFLDNVHDAKILTVLSFPPKIDKVIMEI